MPGKNTVRKGRVAVEHEEWPIELITWKDANSHWGDHALSEIIDEPLPKRHSVGFVVDENAERIVLVGTDDRERDSAVINVADAMEIPPELVIERTPLRKGRRRAA